MLKKTKFLLAVILFFGLTSCQKEINEITTISTGVVPDQTTRVNASVSGFVTDENNLPVSGALVTFGNATTSTDEYGYFRFNNQSVVKTAAVITVKANGYYNGIKTVIAEQNRSSFVRIKLIPKTNQGNFNGAAGGTVTLTNGLSISFPANAIINPISSNNNPYTGVVNVSASWINPTAQDLAMIMPGDLRGIDANGTMKVLQTFGMAAVELFSPSGDKLQIAPGSKATISFPIPAAISSTAPSNIPLWHFDEETGLWREEGFATKNGSSYVGEVSHFSFWNCDVPSNFVQFNCTVLNADGAPVPFAWVKISHFNNSYNSAYGMTDSSGYVSGAIPNNSQLKLEIFTDLNCGTPVYTQTFSTTNVNISLGSITIPASSIVMANVTGTVVDCSNGPVTNGYIIMLKNSTYYRYSLNTSGEYSFSTALCNGPENVSFIGVDMTSGQQSNPLAFTINNGSNNVTAIQACGTTTQQFFNYTINGTNYSLTSPVDTFFMFVNTQSNPATIQISGQNISQGAPSNRYISIGFNQAGIAVGSSQNMSMFYTSNISDSTAFTTPIAVNITEYGAVGQFISGNYSGAFVGALPTSTIYNVTGSFRVRRSQ
ncbi:MAG: hypothetical protein RIR96_769 [Bacteroidota bacterium]